MPPALPTAASSTQESPPPRNCSAAPCGCLRARNRCCRECARCDKLTRMAVTGFLTDSTLCIGCKACEVAFKEWNDVPDDGFVWSGLSYDNTLALGHSTYRHVKFVEREPKAGCGGNANQQLTWEFSSDVCRHCGNAGCLEACPTG